jgi:hypothetical protein
MSVTYCMASGTYIGVREYRPKRDAASVRTVFYAKALRRQVPTAPRRYIKEKVAKNRSA